MLRTYAYIPGATVGKKQRHRAQRHVPREGHELRRLVEWGRSVKNDKRHDEDRDLRPTADFYRDGRLVATVLLWGERPDAVKSIRMGIGGYGADEVLAVFDSYYRIEEVTDPDDLEAQKKSVESRYRRGDFARSFVSPDPAERAAVREALQLLRFKKLHDGTVSREGAMMPYDFDPKRGKYAWGAVKVDPGEGALVDGIEGAFALPSIATVIHEFADIDLPEELDERFELDIATTRVLVKQQKCGVALACYSEEQAKRVDETINNESGFYAKPLRFH